MYISSHTVAFYMRQAFRKLNISSRVELTRIVMQQSQQPATVSPMQGITPQPHSLGTLRSLSSKSLLPGNSAVAR
jgi:Bacterial regulatory proteins, luxR family